MSQRKTIAIARRNLSCEKARNSSKKQYTNEIIDDLFEGGPGGTLDEGVLRAMEATDSELSTTAVKSDLNEDLDINLVQNLLASFGEQNGLSGPASSLLAELLEFKK